MPEDIWVLPLLQWLANLSKPSHESVPVQGGELCVLVLYGKLGSWLHKNFFGGEVQECWGFNMAVAITSQTQQSISYFPMDS